MKLPFWPNPLGYRDIKLGLDRVYQLLERLGNPHLNLPPVIHIAGTNGKGSTLAYLYSILTHAKYRVHRYTSPHLVNFNERIILANQEIEDEFLNQILAECKQAAETAPAIEVTFFEGITVAAFLAFSRVPADVVLLETGMGGRLDATNVIKAPLLSIITPISLDHTEFLGKTINNIAFEKAGIIKPNCPVIIGKQSKAAQDVICSKAIEMAAPAHLYNRDWKIINHKHKLIFSNSSIEFSVPFPNLIGAHQLDNMATAIAALCVQQHFSIDKKTINKAVQKAEWPARIQKISSGKFFRSLPKNYQLFLDGSHNEAGAITIRDWLNQENLQLLKKNRRKPKIYLICAMLGNKDSRGFLRHLSGVADFLVGIDIKDEPKSRSGAEIARIASKIGMQALDADNIEQALEYIIALNDGDIGTKKPSKNLLQKIVKKRGRHGNAKIIICGSLYLAGQFLEKNFAQ